jgi:hypothetical protein
MAPPRLPRGQAFLCKACPLFKPVDAARKIVVIDRNIVLDKWIYVCSIVKSMMLR